jgi:hypothetical protein
VNIGVKIKDTTDSSVGIKNQEAFNVVQQTMSEPIQAKIVEACAREFNANPIYYPMVKALDTNSNQAVPFATLTTGNSFEKCTADSDGRCRLLVAAKHAGARYQIEAKCDLPCSGYSPVSQTFGSDELADNDALTVRLAMDSSLVIFDVVDCKGTPLNFVDVQPDALTATVQNQACWDSHSSGEACRHTRTEAGRATFHFVPRPNQAHVWLTVPDGKQNQVSWDGAVPADRSVVQIMLCNDSGIVGGDDRPACTPEQLRKDALGIISAHKDTPTNAKYSLDSHGAITVVKGAQEYNGQISDSRCRPVTLKGNF